MAGPHRGDAAAARALRRRGAGDEPRGAGRAAPARERRFDSRALLTVVLSGDRRLLQRFETDDAFVPLASRIRARLPLEPLPPETLAEHAAGNLRLLHGYAAELLAVAAQRELRQLDEKLYLEVVAAPAANRARPAARAGRTR
jgi:hypothetical protein